MNCTRLAALGFASLLSVSAWAATVCYDSHATGAGTGENWENAFTDLQAAVNAAGNGGEVRVKQGVHEPQQAANPARIALLGIRLVGGFTGEGDVRSTDRTLTIFNGDFTHDDYYVDAAENRIGDLYDYTNGELIDFRDPTAEEHYWTKKQSGNNVRQLFSASASASATDRLVIEGLTFMGYGGGESWGNHNGALYKGSTVQLFTFTNCNFVGTYIGGANGAGAIQIANDSEIVDCKFLGFAGAQICFGIKPSTASAVAAVRDCTFHSSCSYYASQRSACIVAWEADDTHVSDIQVSNCDFSHITAGDANATAGTYSGLVIGYYNKARITSVSNCVFRDIHVLNVGGPMVQASASVGVVQDCVITNCTVDSPSLPNNGVLCYGGAIKRCRVADNRCRIATETPGKGMIALVYGACTDVEMTDNVLVGDTSGTTILQTGGLSSTGKNIVGNVVSNRTGLAALTGNCSSLKTMRIEGNEVYAAGADVALLGTMATVRDVSIYDNVLAGGTTSSIFFKIQGSPSFLNAVVAKNRHVDYGPDCQTILLKRFGNAESIYVAWSTFYENNAKIQFYCTTTRNGQIRLHLFSSVIWRSGDPSSFEIVHEDYTSTWSKTIGNAGVIIHDSYAKGFDTTHSSYYSSSSYDSGTCYTDEPVFSDKVRRTSDGRAYFVMSRACAYKRNLGARPWRLTAAYDRGKADDIVFYCPTAKKYQFASTGWSATTTVNYASALQTEVPQSDFCGNERPEGKVIIGAVQELAPTGLAVLIR